MSQNVTCVASLSRVTLTKPFCKVHRIELLKLQNLQKLLKIELLKLQNLQYNDLFTKFRMCNHGVVQPVHQLLKTDVHDRNVLLSTTNDGF